jgi:hypothetical protein
MGERIFCHIAERTKRICKGNGKNFLKFGFGRKNVLGNFPEEKFEPGIEFEFPQLFPKFRI